MGSTTRVVSGQLYAFYAAIDPLRLGLIVRVINMNSVVFDRIYSVYPNTTLEVACGNSSKRSWALYHVFPDRIPQTNVTLSALLFHESASILSKSFMASAVCILSSSSLFVFHTNSTVCKVSTWTALRRNSSAHGQKCGFARALKDAFHGFAQRVSFCNPRQCSKHPDTANQVLSVNHV